MLRDNNELVYENLNTSITEHGGLYDLDEILEELKTYYNIFSTSSMSSYEVYLLGQKDMLKKIINYLERVK